jgi:two-component sensor histidine kinase
MLLVFEDVTARRQADLAKDMLLAETHHRMKNLMAVVRALASQTQAKDRTGEQYKEAFMGRFKAVADAQDLLSLNVAETELAAIVGKSLEHVASPRAALSPGPSVKIPAARVLPLTMILHELTTNALKYGALSVPEGIVRASWNTERHDDQARVVLDWREEGGPVASPPSRKGFGTRMIEFSAREMGGEVAVEFAPAGLHVRLTLPCA